jgi:hypothetical protein
MLPNGIMPHRKGGPVACRLAAMRRYVACALLLLIAFAPFGGCTKHQRVTADKDPALAAHIEQLVEKFLTSDDDAANAALLSDARTM